ncbi:MULTISPECIES: hypothetical protein [unclassified Tolypothrix]|uniref:hypothetical protein n=1 Tax=unclassified Tolypothrix TaxID=2649714 RepID=UPI0005EAAB57|nr:MULTISPECIES: hypothetical protein [unclassified Tolypothrix]BAY91439.1 hypothetical protein NIES3275_34620 [Microchaete diplosiphon NIES-3275]EKF05521.1 hypothetical protein FDUTEX481_01694 [Tolypothrix sp. PCC 7601]MBE9086019.1 hypothetical protein [Tolypothrix sp. LEGE 11397]UYD25477.1 hypothetical protein HGR01_29660 [Tolypothrix sp. PCC 7712]UYD32283.1 hypothetical protein HG267_24895 [Tolypothrix sp. PCC 7601]
MKQLYDVILDETIYEIFDNNGCSREVPLREFLALSSAKVVADDRLLGIKRQHIPFKLINLPDKTQTADFCHLANAISNIAVFDVAPDNEDQGIWMRCVQLYWQAKAILLPNKIFRLIPDPTQPGGSIEQILPPEALKNLKLETEADKAMYDLFKAGEPEIISWAESKNIEYPFANFQELFIRMLKSRFTRSVQEEAFRIKSYWTNQRNNKQHYRRWLKYLSNHDLGQDIEQKYYQILMDMKWEGYPLIALRSQQSNIKFKKLWQVYLKTHRALIEIIDTNLYWQGSIPYQTKSTNQRVAVHGTVTQSGYFEWDWQ